VEQPSRDDIPRFEAIDSPLEAKLAVAEARYQRLWDNVPLGLLRLAPDDRIIAVNNSLMQLLKYPNRAALMAKKGRDLYLEPIAFQRWQATMGRDGTVPNMEVQVRCHDGTPLWVKTWARAVYDDAGRLVCYECSWQDISGLKRAIKLQSILFSLTQSTNQASDLEDLLGMVHQQLSSLLDATNFYVALYNETEDSYFYPYVVDEHNQPASEPLGQSLTDYVRRTGQPLLADESSQQSLRQVGIVPGSATSSVLWLGVPLKTSQGVIGVMVLQSYGNPSAYSARDLELINFVSGHIAFAVERKQAEADMHRSEQRYQRVVENIDDALMVDDLDGRITFANQAFLNLFGLTRDDLDGLTLEEISAPEWRVRLREQHNRRIRGEKIPSAYECVGQKKDGTPLNLLFSVVEVVEDGKIVGTQSLIRDLTKSKALEEQLRQAQKMEAMGQLAGGIAHDFNNLLTVITGYTNLVGIRVTQLAPEDRLHQDVDEIRKATERATDLTRQLLAFSRRQILQPRILNLNHNISNVTKMLKRLIGEHIELIVELDDTLWSAKADPGQIEQVIINLSVNARDAMPEGGTLRIQSVNNHLSENLIHPQVVVPKGDYVLIRVSDTGQGMDDATLSDIFLPFFTTKSPDKGTGLGLSMAYGIIKQSEGFILPYSQPGKGATFEILLPKVERPVALSEQRRSLKEAPTGSETVLLVEDEEMVRKMTSRILQRNGYHVLEADNGKTALDLFSEYPDAIHLLLTDVVMPGMNGRELADRLTTQQDDLRVLFISGYTDESIVPHGILDPGVMFLQKPFDPAVLAYKVREVLDSGGVS